ncbi:hypothetical protein Nepgr_016070 [Nepenthes gracilis]|uniref:Uncharacterized protein n=1 Tax=Nepenthes gracilis TaxID=150966 RepID=A0AAD3SP31_NEPGR|nr:hypothetical protein Nepgr_016070 [Nepenthes gracilis]
MGHHSCCNKQKVKRGLWSPEEDEKLINHITTYGHGCWSSVPRLAGWIFPSPPPLNPATSNPSVPYETIWPLDHIHHQQHRANHYDHGDHHHQYRANHHDHVDHHHALTEVNGQLFINEEASQDGHHDIMLNTSIPPLPPHHQPQIIIMPKPRSMPSPSAKPHHYHHQEVERSLPCFPSPHDNDDDDHHHHHIPTDQSKHVDSVIMSSLSSSTSHLHHQLQNSQVGN